MIYLSCYPNSTCLTNISLDQHWKTFHRPFNTQFHYFTQIYRARYTLPYLQSVIILPIVFSGCAKKFSPKIIQNIEIIITLKRVLSTTMANCNFESELFLEVVRTLETLCLKHLKNLVFRMPIIPETISQKKMRFLFMAY